MKKLRLLLFHDCNRNCEGCCNKGFDFSNIPVCDNFDDWDEVYFTGGEPMLKPELIKEVAAKFYYRTKIYVYTAKIDNLDAVMDVLNVVGGLTVTLHEQSDVDNFIKLNDMLLPMYYWMRGKSFRLNIFKEVSLPEGINLEMWKVKDNMVWIKDCPVPSDEVFMTLN